MVTADQARYKMILKLLRLDAEGQEGEGEEESKDEKVSHGNTRLPYGLCKRFGIHLPDRATPREAWDALAGRGVVAKDAFSYLQKHKTIKGYEPDGASESSKSSGAKDTHNRQSKNSDKEIFDNRTYVRNKSKFSKPLPADADNSPSKIVRFTNLHSTNDLELSFSNIKDVYNDGDKIYDELKKLPKNIAINLNGNVYIRRATDVWERVSDIDKPSTNQDANVFITEVKIASDICDFLWDHYGRNGFDDAVKNMVLFQEYDSIELYTPKSFKGPERQNRDWNPCESDTSVKRDPKYFGNCIKPHEHKSTPEEAQQYLSEQLNIPVAYGHLNQKAKNYMSADLANRFNDALISLVETYHITNIVQVKSGISGVMATVGCGKSSGESEDCDFEVARTYDVTPNGLVEVAFAHKWDKMEFDRLCKEWKDRDNSRKAKGETSYDKRQRENLEKKLKYHPGRYAYGSSYYEPGKEIESVVAHEIGHVLMHSKMFSLGIEGIINAWNIANANGDIFKVSAYAASKPKEFFAEVFALCVMGHADELPDYMIRMVEAYID